MTEPQQPEIARSRRGATSDSAAKAKASRVAKKATAGTAPIPEENLPGHHPEVEQDKPVGPPPIPGTSKAAKAAKSAKPKPQKASHHATLHRDQPFATVSRAFGVTDETAYVDVDGERLEIRFGPWRLTTPLANVTGASVTGPFHWWKVIGPPHLSLKDRGITFATSAQRGVCIQFREPVAAIDPRGVIRHPAATVTVEDPDTLVRVLTDAKAA